MSSYKIKKLYRPTSILPGIYCENVWLSDMFVLQVIFFDEKRGEYECIAVAHHQDTALLQTGPWEKCITNRRSYVLKPSYQLPFFLRRFFCTFY